MELIAHSLKPVKLLDPYKRTQLVASVCTGFQSYLTAPLGHFTVQSSETRRATELEGGLLEDGARLLK